MLGACARLMRLDKPIGSLLLLAPTLWALWVAGQGRPDPVLASIIIVGVFVTRSVGCVINDIADRDIDGHVKRTRQRPLVAGDIGLSGAIGLAVALGLVAFGLLMMLPRSAWGWATFAVLVTFIYPRFKRFFAAPQLVLSVAFSMGIPMVWAAYDYVSGQTIIMLWVVNILWVLVYDTEYAMSDRPDDIKLGLRSTAILLGTNDRWVIALWQAMCILLLAYIGFGLKVSSVYYAMLVFSALSFVYQQWLIRGREREACFKAFKNNAWFGFSVWMAFVLGLPVTS
ncbi:MAG: 4-hydroxybenzoate octaprenyltransferase [Proteobacteria bacterium]|nr:4-hydroxybenzoate octaprenyltransferase [Pseudomonadota bacterium]